jgi:hypothetical protein
LGIFEGNFLAMLSQFGSCIIESLISHATSSNLNVAKNGDELPMGGGGGGFH